MSKKKVKFDGSCYDYYMRNNGLACGFNMPNALKGEKAHGLPPYAKRMPFLVDEYPACPNNWMHGSDIVSSYFAGLEEDWALWLDFNDCFDHTHDVAVVLSVQGINPVTGYSPKCKNWYANVNSITSLNWP